MPEQTNVSYKERQYKLSDADRNGQIIVMYCSFCRTKHNFRPKDIELVLGDVSTFEVERFFSCRKCGKKDYLSSRPMSVGADSYGKLPVRELVEVYWVKKTRWKDGVL